MSLQDILANADEDLLRELSDFRHHYPVEQTILEEGDGLPRIDSDGMEPVNRFLVVCGCDERMGYSWGSPGHQRGTQP